MLEGKSSYFLSNSLMNEYRKNIRSARKAIIGLDVNRIGRHMVAFNVPIRLPKDLLTLANRYYKLTNNQVKKLNSSLKMYGKKKDTLNYCKNKGELKRVHNRRNNILHEIRRKLPYFIGAVIVKNRSKELCVERMQNNPRGKRGALARAIYNMPDNENIFEKAVSIASNELGYKVNLIKVDPRNTSTKHFKCGGVIQRTQSSYDYASCQQCGQRVNTHTNAAKNIAHKGEKLSQSINLPSSHVRDTGTVLSSDV